MVKTTSIICPVNDYINLCVKFLYEAKCAIQLVFFNDFLIEIFLCKCQEEYHAIKSCFLFYMLKINHDSKTMGCTFFLKIISY